MIHVFGDSHGNFNFKGLTRPNQNYHINSTTMHKVGRDRLNYIDFNNYNIKNGDTIIYQVGEVDCRCHIGKQLKLGRKLNEIITTLSDNFIKSIEINADRYNDLKVIVACVPPPTKREDVERIHGPITHKYPFVDSDDERVNYTKLLNINLKKLCDDNNYIFLDYYSYYSDENGCLIFELSDTTGHIRDNNRIIELINKIME